MGCAKRCKHHAKSDCCARLLFTITIARGLSTPFRAKWRRKGVNRVALQFGDGLALGLQAVALVLLRLQLVLLFFYNSRRCLVDKARIAQLAS